MTANDVLISIESWLWSGALVPVPTLAEVADSVRELSDVYTVGRGTLPREQRAGRHLVAKALYFLCSDAPKVCLALDACRDSDAGFADGSRIVDLGCGVGATSVGLLAWLAANRGRVGPISIVGVDREAASLALWRRVVLETAARAGARVEVETRTDDLLDTDVTDADLVLCQTALNESLGASERHDERTARAVGRWASACRTLVIEPALRTTTRALQHLRDEVLSAGAAHVVAPCPHQLRCPMLARPYDWCHVARRMAATPRVADVQALTRRRDERSLLAYVAFAPGAARAAPTGGVELRLVGEPLGSRGKTERWACASDGSLRCLRVLDRERSPMNAALLAAECGDRVVAPAGLASDRIGPDQEIVAVPSRI